MDAFSDVALLGLVMRGGSLSAAARELDVTTAAVSRRLSRLEERLGVRLLNRTTRRISLTSEGEVYLERGERLLAELADLEAVVSRSREVPKGLLRVNATLGFGRSHLAPLVSRFASRHPEVEIQLQLTDHPLNLAEEAFDVGIRFGELPDTRLIARRLTANRRLLCAAPAYLERRGWPRTAHDLARHDCIILRQNHSAYGVWRMTNPRGQVETVKVRGRFSTNDGEAALGWALDGHGILMRAEWDVARHIAGGALCRVLPDHQLPAADIHAVYPERHNLSAKVRAFIDFLVAELEREPITPDKPSD